MKRVFYSVWDSLILSIPLVVMGLLALGTYWLVRNTPVPEVAQPEPVRGHEPDYYMKRFSIRTYDEQGHLRSEIQGDVARHYPDTQWIEIDGIRIRSVDAEGRISTAQAEHGLTDDHATEVQLIGKARINRTGARGDAAQATEYRSEFLHAFLKAERIRSHMPVQILRGKDHIEANSLDYDDAERQLLLAGRVRATLQPSAP